MRYWIEMPDRWSPSDVSIEEYGTGLGDEGDDGLLVALKNARLGVCASCAYAATSGSNRYGGIFTVILDSDHCSGYHLQVRSLDELVSFALGDGAERFQEPGGAGGPWRVREFRINNQNRSSGAAQVFRKGVPLCPECASWFDMSAAGQNTEERRFATFMVQHWAGLIP